ncbi:MAG: hypothetical protein ACRD39_03620 [Nitrososphaeraceae archaeon]
MKKQGQGQEEEEQQQAPAPPPIRDGTLIMKCQNCLGQRDLDFTYVRNESLRLDKLVAYCSRCDTKITVIQKDNDPFHAELDVHAR